MESKDGSCRGLGGRGGIGGDTALFVLCLQDKEGQRNGFLLGDVFGGKGNVAVFGTGEMPCWELDGVRVLLLL